MEVQTIQLHRPLAPKPGARWTVEAVEALFELPFKDLLFRAQQVHREHFGANEVQLSTLLSIKTGGCPEDCGYCPQSVHYDTGVEAGKLMAVDEVLDAARAAQAHGATRFCMGAAWREPKDRDIEKVAELVSAVKDLGLETCCTLGMLTDTQARSLKDAGLDYYNHNLDTAPEAYGRIIHTRDYQDRLDTLERVRDAGIHVCCGGIVGMGESRRERASSPTWSRIPSRCRSTSWCRWKARRCTASTSSTRSSSCAPSQWRASPCRKRACACRPGASR
jgi:biotin synthase